jgi:hypothetical protein
MISNERLPIDYNPDLAEQGVDETNPNARRGSIESSGEADNLVWQTRVAPPTQYEQDLAGGLVQAFEAGETELSELVAHLIKSGVLDSSHGLWTEASLEAELEHLGQ